MVENICTIAHLCHIFIHLNYEYTKEKRTGMACEKNSDEAEKDYLNDTHHLTNLKYEH